MKSRHWPKKAEAISNHGKSTLHPITPALILLWQYRTNDRPRSVNTNTQSNEIAKDARMQLFPTSLEGKTPLSKNNKWFPSPILMNSSVIQHSFKQLVPPIIPSPWKSPVDRLDISGFNPSRFSLPPFLYSIPFKFKLATIILWNESLVYWEMSLRSSIALFVVGVHMYLCK